MKMILSTKYLILNAISMAFQGLRLLCDPSIEGDPYVTHLPPSSRRIKEIKTQGFGRFGRRKYAFRNY